MRLCDSCDSSLTLGYGSIGLLGGALSRSSVATICVYSVQVCRCCCCFADELIFWRLCFEPKFEFSPKTWKVKYSNSALASHNTATTSPPLASLAPHLSNPGVWCDQTDSFNHALNRVAKELGADGARDSWWTRSSQTELGGRCLSVCPFTTTQIEKKWTEAQDVWRRSS
jgi:hypothetical protein